MKVLISTGDYSADLHGEALVRELRKLDPQLHVSALGGVKLKSVADRFLVDMVELDVSGFSQPVKQFFRLKGILQETVFPILDGHQVDAVILIDYYGFNIHVAKRAKRNGIPVYYFVSPQVWASRKHRIQQLKKAVTKMLVIFPFEEKLYREHGVPVQFVGHPLMDAVARVQPASANGKVRVGLLPGSRLRELVRHIPILLRSYQDLKRRFPSIEGSLFAVDSIPESTYRQLIAATPGLDRSPELQPQLVHDSGYALRSQLTLALTASGTATLENALLGLPMVVIYQTSWLTYWVAKRIIQVPYISMPNILSGSQVVPELIQDRANADELAREAGRFLGDPALLERTRRELIKLKDQLGPPGAYLRAAQAITQR